MCNVYIKSRITSGKLFNSNSESYRRHVEAGFAIKRLVGAFFQHPIHKVALEQNDGLQLQLRDI